MLARQLGVLGRVQVSRVVGTVDTGEEVVPVAAGDDDFFPRFQRGYFAASAISLVADQDF